VLTTLTSFFFFFGSMAQVVHTQESNKISCPSSTMNIRPAKMVSFEPLHIRLPSVGWLTPSQMPDA
jgi:hypothetical protein